MAILELRVNSYQNVVEQSSLLKLPQKQNYRI